MNQPWFESDTVDELCKKINEYMGPLIDKYRKGIYGDEDDLASQFVSRVEVAVEHHTLRYLPAPGLHYGLVSQEETQLSARSYGLTGRKTTFRNEHAEEPEFGADILFVFESGADHLKKKKGMLIQCKDTHHQKFKHTSRPDLHQQCQKMQRVTDESYVLFFGDSGFKFARNPLTFEQTNFGISAENLLDLEDVFHSFFVCTGGDENINTAIKGEFYEVANELVAKRALIVRTGGPEAELAVDPAAAPEAPPAAAAPRPRNRGWRRR